METIRTVELFAGVGGFRLGLESASEKFKVIWANQWEPSMREQYAFDCYTAHFGSDKHYICQDIAKAKMNVPDHDLLVGGFPCQDYSIMKKNSAGIEGTKGVLWWQIDDILREKRPKYVLLENVDRIIRSPAKQCGRDFSIILRCLYEKEYAVEWRVINAADYGYAKGAKHEKRRKRDGSQYYFSEGCVQFPEPLDKPSRTMLTSESQIGRTSHVVQDQTTGRLRVLTPIECERLNGFPDGWTDTGMPERMRYFCMGNALVVPLVTRIAHMLIAVTQRKEGTNAS